MRLRNKKNVCFVIFGFITLTLFYQFVHKKKKTTRSYNVVSVVETKTSEISTVLESIGTILSNESANITSNVAQVIESINFSDCEFVKKGTKLVQLNVDKKKAAQKRAEINLSEQKRESDRLLGLKNKKVVPDKEYDIQQTKLLDAQAKLDEINAEIKESTIIAPFDGILGFRRVSVGSLVSPGVVITTIDDISTVKLDFPIPEKYTFLLEKNEEVIAESKDVCNNKKFYGRISAISSRISSNSGSVLVRATVENKDFLLRPGMMIKATIHLKKRDGIQIPESCVSSLGEKHFVFLIQKDKNIYSAHKQYVSIGERKKGVVEIKKGLQANQLIVKDGINKLSDKDIVKIVDEKNGDI